MDELLRQLGASGPIGIIAAISIYVAIRKDRELQKANEKMLAMQEKMLGQYYAAIGETNKTVRALADRDERE